MMLNQLKAGESGRILSVGGSGALRRRLMDMGLTPGTLLYVRKVAPLGDPFEIWIRGYELTLRKEDTNDILIEKLPGQIMPGSCPRHGLPHGKGNGHRKRRGFWRRPL